MPAASESVVPWFTHRRMLPKWAGWVVTGALALAFPAPDRLLLFGIGVLIFFPSEYVVHRGVFHGFANRPLGRVVSRQHIHHHEDPSELDSLFNYPPISVGIGLAYFVVYFAVTGDAGAAGALSFGNFTGLLYYEWVHLAAHRPGSRPRTPWARAMKRAHLLHHYKNEHHWYGVTAPAGVLDRALGTWPEAREVAASATVRTLKPTADAEAALAAEE